MYKEKYNMFRQSYSEDSVELKQLKDEISSSKAKYKMTRDRKSQGSLEKHIEEQSHAMKILVDGMDTTKEMMNEFNINFLSMSENIIVEFNNNETKSIFKSEFNFKELGIGGLDKQFEVIFRRAFASRAIPTNICKDLGINHVRGILLYGPPGCGKSLTARQIGKILNCEEPKIVNGPSLLSKFHGESEENVRKLFADAIADTQNKKLHLIICDEFDALARKRGNSSNDLNDKIVNQFL